MNRRRLSRLVVLVDLLAVGSFALLFGRHGNPDWSGTFLLATLIALAGATPVRLPGMKTSVSATDPFLLTALAAFGPVSACIVASAGVVGSTVARESGRHVRHIAFNLGNVVLSTALASAVYLALGGSPGAPTAAQVWPLLFAATVYFLLNTGLVTAAISIDGRRPFLATWRESGLWMAVTTYGGLTLAVGLLHVLQVAGPSGLALGVPPCWLLAAFYRTHKERQEAQQQRIDRVEGLNQQLEDKVAERTSELQQALSGIEQVNTRLRQANERLTDANRAKSEFLANVSHELRTPLNAIIGFSGLLSDRKFGALGEQQREFVRDINESGEHLLRLINGILDLSKIEAGKMEVHRERFDAAKLTSDTVAMVRHQAAVEGLELTVDDGRRSIAVNLDPGMYRQVLLNLLSNAIKFTPAGGWVRVEISADGTDLSCRVIDSGIGIEAGDLERIFTEFFQVDGSYSRSYEGTGLGLALVRKMVGMHGGSVEVRSTPGAGSTFSLRFPDAVVAAAEPPPGADRRAPPPPASRGPATPPSDDQPPAILVIEDNPVNRKLARNVLRSRGYEVWEAASGEEGLRVLLERRPALVLMDIQLPGMDGLETTRRIKRDPLTADLPVIALTAHAWEADEQRARDAGCSGYITKPIRLADFPAQIAAFLRPAPAEAG
ncbi:MAG TPA: ATP-binding protein [Candidatus Polarisedimenticolaceae bacterium]|nr:ATP-binding protein [Candidatus Polarisedimenticolaceae bacterium]